MRESDGFVQWAEYLSLRHNDWGVNDELMFLTFGGFLAVTPR